MNIYVRILGILCLLIILAASIIVIMLIIDGGRKEFLFFIPIYILAHFLIAHKFGFDYKNESTGLGKVFLYTSSVTLIVIIAIPTFFIVEKRLEENRNRQDELTFSTTKDLGIKESAYGIEGTLKIKYFQGDVLFQFYAEKKKVENLNVYRFNVEFLDKEGFKVGSIVIDDFSVELDDVTELPKAYRENSSTSMSLEDFRKIENWSFSIFSN